ncbi:MAG: hypothetical protein JNM89_02715 [Hyphomicrobiaceae bacterium]|nr:hypothetical protein [Hyphomicrobiaceae bacterium]
MARIDKLRMRAVLGDAPKPVVVWQQQFDGFNETLHELARSDWDQIPEVHLWEYIHDLAYQRLQPDLFRHVFPACLKFWYDTLMRDEGAEYGDADLHYALLHGEILSKMLDDAERQRAHDFFTDGFLDRIEIERGFRYERPGRSANAWIFRLNSIGLVAPIIPEIWPAWWNVDSPGKAVSAVMYATGLVYLGGENPIYQVWTREKGGGGPYLTEWDCSVFDRAWLEENIAFLRATLTPAYVLERLDTAATVLAHEPEGEMARRISHEAADRTTLIEMRIADLLANLARFDSAKDRWL